MINKDSFYELVKKAAASEVIKTKSFIIAANWKMNKNTKEVSDFLDSMNKETWKSKNTIILFPPSPYLYLMRDRLRYSNVLYGVQNVYWEAAGAFTGEISLGMARDFGCKYTILGHSERRNLFFETDEMMGKKVEASIFNGITPILCIGENINERNSNSYKEKLKNQLIEGLKKLDANMASNIIIAYEPVWAIGTGLNASPDQVEETHIYIRSVLEALYGEAIGCKIPILYGGSVKATNVIDIALAKDVSGFLIGGASLNFNEFKAIINSLDIMD